MSAYTSMRRLNTFGIIYNIFWMAWTLFWANWDVDHGKTGSFVFQSIMFLVFSAYVCGHIYSRLTFFKRPTDEE